MKVLRIYLLTSMLFTLVMLSACVTTASHLYTVRKQVCEFNEFFSVEFDRSVEVEMKEPVLTERDVVLLIGAPPTSRVENAEGVVASYLFKQIHANPETRGSLVDETFEIELLFEASGDKHLLTGIRSSEIPAEFHASVQYATANVSEAAEQACDIRLSLLSRSTELKIDRETLELIPGRDSIISWLGAPHASSEADEGLAYSFKLVGADGDLPVVRISVNYDQPGEDPTQIEVSFTRYHASIDVPDATMRVSLNQASR